MANQRHLEEIQKGSENWNRWRANHGKTKPDLCFAHLSGLNLPEADLSGADLYGAVLSRANLDSANMRSANLAQANLTDANLRLANLCHTNLSGANLRGANFNDAKVGWTIFSDVDLSQIKCLHTVKHFGPSSIGVETLHRSGDNIPGVFLRGCGLPDDFITYILEYIKQQSVIQFYSCFISCSHKDEEFANHLHLRLCDAKIPVWYAPKDVNLGVKTIDQIVQAIRVYEKLLVILSEHSLNSEWVRTEIRKARQVERESGRRKLFPIRLIDMKIVQGWECFDATSGQDLADEVRAYPIPDFSFWKNPDLFEESFRQLLNALRQSQEQVTAPKKAPSG